MKTDIEKFVELYKSFGIDCIVNEQDDKKVILLNALDSQMKGRSIVPTKSDKFGGYIGFNSEVIFSSDGSFIAQNFWE